MPKTYVLKMIAWTAKLAFKRPLFFLVKPLWIERNEPLKVCDVGPNLLELLKRRGNEDGQYVLIGFDVSKESKHVR